MYAAKIIMKARAKKMKIPKKTSITAVPKDGSSGTIAKNLVNQQI
jgi:hypothetical protein